MILKWRNRYRRRGFIRQRISRNTTPAGNQSDSWHLQNYSLREVALNAVIIIKI